MNGRVFVITGARGTGKSTLASQFLPPEQVHRTYYQDAEKSATQIVDDLTDQGLAFGRYVSILDRFSDLPPADDLLHRINRGQLPWVSAQQRRTLAEYYQWILDDLDVHLTRGEYSVFVHDTLEKLEAGMAAWVELNKAIAGVTRTAYGGLWTDGVYPLYSQLISAIHARGVETIILTSHLRTPWEDNRPVVGKVAPAGKKLLYQLSSLMIWLVNEPANADGAPAGLVLKERLGRTRAIPGSWQTRRMLPRRIPHCTWADIHRYLSEGCDLANPAPGENLSPSERDMISELLTDEQMRLMILSAEVELAELRHDTPSLITPSSSLADQIQSLAEEGMMPEDIAEHLGKPLVLIRRHLGGTDG